MSVTPTPSPVPVDTVALDGGEHDGRTSDDQALAVEAPAAVRAGAHDDGRTDAPAKPGRAFPIGPAPGAAAFLGAWVVGWAIARLTGAAAVVLLLVAGLVAIVGAAGAGWWRLRSVEIVEVRSTSLATAGTDVDVVVVHADRSASAVPVTVAVDVAGGTARAAVDPGGTTRLTLRAERAGVHRTIDLRVESAGAAGLMWWRRSVRRSLPPMHVAPPPHGPALPRSFDPTALDGTTTAPTGPAHGDIDGVRTWREGESDQAIHWASTLRSGELVAHDRARGVEARWIVPIDGDAARLRHTLDAGLRAGVAVVLRTADGPDRDTGDGIRAGGTTPSSDVPIRTHDDAARWAAIAAGRQPATTDEPARWWRRELRLARGLESDIEVEPAARATLAAGALVAIWMLIGALDAPASAYALSAAGVTVAALVSRVTHEGRRPTWTRVVVGTVALGALVRIAIEASGITGLLEALRGPLPDLLMLLVVLHGAETVDRRTARVHAAIVAVVVAYAAGLRIDERVGWWMLAWTVLTVVTLRLLAGRTPRPAATGRPEGATRRVSRTVVWAAAGTVATIAVGAFVPIPDGPASLGLPALSDDSARIDTPGALVGPDGSTGPSSGDRRGALGEVGGYPGFSPTLDTSVRGDLGDEVVMRVRAPEPAFWRGQTFTDFDGRVWHVASEDGRRVSGPEVVIEPTVGDLPSSGVPTERFVQTYHAEVDLPNLVFAAARADTVIFDGDLFPRPDGAIRTDRTLTPGSVYTVVSDRVQVTADLLRGQGDVAARFAAVTDPRADAILDPLLALPASTSARTVELAERLAVEGSTYDTILAYERWLAANTEYDLDAPVPADGADAVDDYLFVSRRGFCEQIASALVVMLRSQGVPSRLATGYLPGERDRVSGVWEVRARDAHAWVEVWFPDSGWQAFDPTADVPLAGDADRSTVGADAAGAVIDAIRSHPIELGAMAGTLLLGVGALRAVRRRRHRRERGEWGRLHDRFVELVRVDDAGGSPTAPIVATALAAAHPDDPQVGALAHRVAADLDRAGFDPSWHPDDDDLRRVEGELTALRRRLRDPERAGRVSASS